jgi:Helix-turn-helix domain
VYNEAASDVPAGIEILPVVAVTQTFPARPSSIPDIRDFVRRFLDESPLTAASAREVEETVSHALLEAAGPDGTIQVVFRIFPDHTEVDVLRSAPFLDQETAPAGRRFVDEEASPAAPSPSRDAIGAATSFAEWMAAALRRDGLTHEVAARRLGVSVKTVGRWVGGETEPRLRDLRRIHDVFGEVPFP